MSRIPLPRLLPLWVVCALALSSRGEAQPKPEATSAWVLSFCFGAGNLSMDGDSLGRNFGLGTQVRFGRIVEPGVIAGFQARSWSASETDTLRGSSSGTTELSRQVQIVALTATKYLTGRGFYLRGGAGVCSVRQEFLVHQVPPPPGTPGPSVGVTHQDAGFAATGAAGWERMVRRRVGVGIDVEYARFVAAHVGGDFLNYTAGLNLYW